MGGTLLNSSSAGRRRRRGGGARFDLFFHSKTGAFDQDGFGVVEEAVEHGGGDGAVIVEDGGPLLEGFVGGQHDGTPFITLADDLEEQIGTVLVNRQVADFV